MSKNVRISIASDYGVLEAGQYRFYYGYEYEKGDFGEIWGFRATKNGKMILEYPVKEKKFDVIDRLFEGIGNYLAGLP